MDEGVDDAKTEAEQKIRQAERFLADGVYPMPGRMLNISANASALTRTRMTT